MAKDTKGTNPDAGDVRGDVVRQLASILDETDLTEIEYEASGMRIRVARQVSGLSNAFQVAPAAPAPSAQAASAPTPAAPPSDPAAHPGAVKAPMVGVAYLRPDPDSAEFIKQGDNVSEGQTLLLIEAMKTFNPVHAPKSGTVTSILVSDGQPIEFDQPLIVIE
jgi:acetyl-CoA carboxylase biotin carboxyl carrier protein